MAMLACAHGCIVYFAEGLLTIQPRDRWSLEKVLTELRSLGVDYNSPVKLPFEEFQISLNIIPNNQSSTSLLHSIRGKHNL